MFFKFQMSTMNKQIIELQRKQLQVQLKCKTVLKQEKSWKLFILLSSKTLESHLSFFLYESEEETNYLADWP